ncbi:TIGR00282 family metallophosphoesterase [Alicyclobacillus sp. TC]|uniref:TIGR00282 family metallophosphoesterase n=2 Tax=Alicyclobacillus tolerans TaxID=90970 RepID=A0A1M6X5E2_9BACL|nr:MULTISPECIES: TIGR00282 family metallophosphoesterase [Alicyclobacillus]MDP9728919.1 metallophosphoesterase (TIGR00282 family) [Alicyclobacillus tengchongensis]QRF23657.1 TIGR00282 family metallophosphoesterase [Alicyclobacillus sp. TC]SHL01210.1 hypothetical protein SAMN05443507_1323 [Alicyclobacillus montanus]
MKIWFIGDIVGQPGREYAGEIIRKYAPLYQPDLIVANGENASHGRGITSKSAEELYDAGVELITLGNHTWDQKDLLNFIDHDQRIVRPANYPLGTPGRGYTICKVGQISVLLINAMGRAFISELDSPFRAIDEILLEHPSIHHVLVDFHAEATSEKLAMGWYLDGRVSAVVGTHTHVPTNDARILPQGTAYITDLGMTGPRDGILGMDRTGVLERMLTHRPARFEVAAGRRQFCSVFIELDDHSGKACSIEPFLQYEE